MSDQYECDAVVVLGALAVFGLPLTLLIPGFTIWDVVPKVHISRFHIISLEFSWAQLNALIITTLVVLFCVYLEIRKRKLDDLVEKVLTVSQATDDTMGVERLRQSTAVKACVELIDASTEHYENLVLLLDEIRKREKMKQQHPPTIDSSIANMKF